MKTLITALALAALVAAPAITPSAVAAAPNDVIVGGNCQFGPGSPFPPMPA